MSSFLSPTITFTKRVLVHPRYFWILATLVVVGDAVLTQLVVRFISCTISFHIPGPRVDFLTDTEIDWETYMRHIELYLKGERNYSNITGPTGPLVCVALRISMLRF
jgi:alpha-1,3-mannosyltransferase